ncbi:MAG TPA: hypothetical protein VFU46_07450, partial [Gemmatimonadales bacterium]|nr:hypothetical protein [Gemmatimonadales bacterium]
MVWLVLAPAASAQDDVRLTRDAPFARGADGKVLGTLRTGAEVTAGPTRGGWIQVTLEGWIISGSVGRDVRDGFELGVSADRGENIRAEPNGRIVARLRYGALLERVGARGGWVKVRRTGWLSRRAVDRVVETAQAPRGGPDPARPLPVAPGRARP